MLWPGVVMNTGSGGGSSSTASTSSIRMMMLSAPLIVIRVSAPSKMYTRSPTSTPFGTRRPSRRILPAPTAATRAQNVFFCAVSGTKNDPIFASTRSWCTRIRCRSGTISPSRMTATTSSPCTSIRSSPSTRISHFRAHDGKKIRSPGARSGAGRASARASPTASEISESAICLK